MADSHDPPRKLAYGLVMLMAGAVVGAAVVLLLEPRFGQGLRARVLGAGNWRDLAAEALVQGRERVISAVELRQDRRGGNNTDSDLGAVRPF